jgi:hypothetical protein
MEKVEVLRMRLWILSLAMVMSCVAPAVGQTTRPAATGAATAAAKAAAGMPPVAWDAAVDKLSRALSESDAAALVESLTERVTIKTFDGGTGDGARLLARVSRGSLVFGKTYKGVPDRLATSIADTVGNTEAPEEARQSWLIAGEEHAKRADLIAAEWVELMLEAKGEDLTAVLLFWRAKPPAPGEAPTFEPVFVLVKGREPAEGHVEIVSVAYGNPVAAAAPKK